MKLTEEINSEYSSFVDKYDEKQWDNIIHLFRDATVNQTWAYNHLRSKKCSTLVLKSNGTVVAAAMVRLITLKGLKIGIAYLGSGPLWRLKCNVDNINVLRNVFIALRNEYVIKRKLFMRISPYMYALNLKDCDLTHMLLGTSGFKFHQITERTLFLDLEPSEDELRKGLHPKWRNLLNRGEKIDFDIQVGTSDDLFRSFKEIYKEMLARKNYSAAISIDEIERIQSALPENLKYTIIICKLENHPMAGGVFSTIGDTGVYFLGATSNAGKKNSSSYMVQWEMIKWMKKNGLFFYDLGGCSPEKIPETYHFKAGICGKNHKIYHKIGIIDACQNPLSEIAFKSGVIIKKYLNLIRNKRSL